MKKSQNHKKINEEIDMDPYSTNILDQLLESHSQWKGCEEIVQLTFRAMSDILQIQGQSIKDMKSILTTRASKNQLTTGLSLKANISDVSKTIQQISTMLQGKISYNQMSSLLKQYVSRNDMTEIMCSNCKDQKNQNGYSTKKQQHQRPNIESQSEGINLEIKILKTRMDQFQKQIAKKISNCATLNQLQQTLNILEMKANSQQVNQALQNVVSMPYLTACLQKKMNKTDFNSFMSSKADAKDLQYIISSLQSKVSLTTLQKLTQVIQNKVDKSDFTLFINERASLNKSQQRNIFQQMNERLQSFATSIKQQIQQLKQSLESALDKQTKNQLSAFKKQLKQLRCETQKNMNLIQIQQNKILTNFKLQISQDVSHLTSQIKSLQDQMNFKSKGQTFARQLASQISLRKRCEQKIYEEIDQVRRKLEDHSSKSIDINQLIKLKSQIFILLDGKIQADHLQQALNRLSVQLTKNIQKSYQDSTLLLDKVQKTFSEAISINTSDISKFQKSLAKKQDKYDHSLVEQNIRKARKQVDQCRKTVDKSYQQMQNKISITEYETDLMQIKKRFDKITKEIQAKANIKDVCVLVDSKPNIDDVNNALKQLNEALNQKINETQLQTVLKDQSSINQTLCSQNIVGRWMWQSGDIKAGGLIPWQIQSANTVPQHFFWEKDKTSILILAPGIYQLKACIFSQNSKINILINGETLAQNNEQNNQNILNTVQQTTIGGRKTSLTSKKKKQKSLNGSKIQQFVILPARSRISMVCQGQVGEGFLNIKRL